jgi:hypothetical protein
MEYLLSLILGVLSSLITIWLSFKYNLFNYQVLRFKRKVLYIHNNIGKEIIIYSDNKNPIVWGRLFFKIRFHEKKINKLIKFIDNDFMKRLKNNKTYIIDLCNLMLQLYFLNKYNDSDLLEGKIDKNVFTEKNWKNLDEALNRLKKSSKKI